MPWDDKSKGEPAKMAGGGPWGSGGSGGGSGGGDNGSPWNRPPSGGNGGGGNNDLEDQMRRMQERFKKRGGGNGGKGGGGFNFGPLGFALVAIVALLGWLSTGIVVVDEGSRAAVFRLGQWQTNYGPGLHFHLPTPIDTHEILPSERQQETTVGGGARETDSLMLTGDESIVDVQFRVFWFYDRQRPERFILNVDEGGELVKATAESVMREVVGKSELDAIITTSRGQIQKEVAEQTQKLMDEYNAGVEIASVEIQKAEYPGEVRDAFADVVKASQDAARIKEEARKYANDIVPRAEGQAAKVLEDAQAYRDQVIANATGEADRFSSILEEYRKAPRVTRERMYLETMEKVLESSDKLILDNDSGAVPYLPIERTRPQGGN